MNARIDTGSINSSRLFGYFAPAYLANGYSPIPIQWAGKAPGWTNTDQSPSHLFGWQNHCDAPMEAGTIKHLSGVDAGIGIACGNGVIGLDIDILDEALAASIDAQIVDHLKDRPGEIITRVGQWPKRTLILRCDELVPTESRSWIDASGVKQGVDIISKGRQTVCEGIHQKTGKPYHWIGGRSPANVPASALKTITATDVQWLWSILPVEARRSGSTNKPRAPGEAAPISDPTSAVNEQGQRAAAAYILDRIPSGPPCGWDTWIKIAFALENAFGEDGYALFQRYSQRHAAFDQAVTDRNWKSARETNRRNSGFGTIINLGKQHGICVPSSIQYNDVPKPATDVEIGDLSAFHARLLAELHPQPPKPAAMPVASADDEDETPEFRRAVTSITHSTGTNNAWEGYKTRKEATAIVDRDFDRLIATMVDDFAGIELEAPYRSFIAATRALGRELRGVTVDESGQRKVRTDKAQRIAAAEAAVDAIIAAQPKQQGEYPLLFPIYVRQRVFFVLAHDMGLGKSRIIWDKIIGAHKAGLIDLRRCRIYLAAAMHSIINGVHVEDIKRACAAHGVDEKEIQVTIHKGIAEGCTADAKLKALNKRAADNGASAAETGCTICPIRETCEVLLSQRNGNAGVHLITHKHLATENSPHHLVAKGAVPTLALIVDEDFQESLIKRFVISYTPQYAKQEPELRALRKRRDKTAEELEAQRASEAKSVEVLDRNAATASALEVIRKRLSTERAEIAKLEARLSAIDCEIEGELLDMNAVGRMLASVKPEGEETAVREITAELVRQYCPDIDKTARHFKAEYDALTKLVQADIKAELATSGTDAAIKYESLQRRVAARFWYNFASLLAEQIEGGATRNLGGDLAYDKANGVFSFRYFEPLDGSQRHAGNRASTSHGGMLLAKLDATARLDLELTATDADDVEFHGVKVKAEHETRVLMPDVPYTMKQFGMHFKRMIVDREGRHSEYPTTKAQVTKANEAQRLTELNSILAADELKDLRFEAEHRFPRDRADSSRESVLRLAHILQARGFKVGIITYKGHGQYVLWHSLDLPDTYALGQGAQPLAVGHVGAITGSRAFEDLDYLFCLARPAPAPDDILRSARARYALCAEIHKRLAYVTSAKTTKMQAVTTGDAYPLPDCYEFPEEAVEVWNKALTVAPLEQLQARGRGINRGEEWSKAKGPLVTIQFGQAWTPRPYDVIVAGDVVNDTTPIAVIEQSYGLIPETATKAHELFPRHFPDLGRARRANLTDNYPQKGAVKPLQINTSIKRGEILRDLECVRKGWFKVNSRAVSRIDIDRRANAPELTLNQPLRQKRALQPKADMLSTGTKEAKPKICPKLIAEIEALFLKEHGRPPKNLELALLVGKALGRHCSESSIQRARTKAGSSPDKAA